MLRLIILLSIILCPSVSLAGIYWVDTAGGAASWAACESVSDPGAGNRCTLEGATGANANAAAGDTVYLVAGTDYTVATGWGIITPAHSGESGNLIHFTSAPGGDKAKIVSPSGHRAILIQGQDYIKISNLDFTDSAIWFHIGNGADYNEITGCTFSNATGAYSLGIIENKTTGGTGGTASTHNWIHANTFEKYGYVRFDVAGCDDIGTIRILADETDESYYNTIEDNTFAYGGHDCFDLGGKYNVVRNNVFHNEEAYFQDTGGNCTNSPSSGYFGNRNLVVTNYTGLQSQYNLIEGNRLGHAGTPPDGQGANGIENAGANMIVRYNAIFGNGQAGILFKAQSSGFHSSNNRVFNNTIYKNGFGDTDLNSGFMNGIHITAYTLKVVTNGGNTYTCIKTHTSQASNEPGVGASWETYWSLTGTGGLAWSTGTTYVSENLPKDNIIKNNIVYANKNEKSDDAVWGLINTYSNNLNTYPGWDNNDTSDKASLVDPSLRLLSTSSTALDQGTYLTLASGAGDNNATLHVDDALYFQDGTWGSSLSNIQADWIAIGTVTNVVQIRSIDYDNNTITLVEAKSWADDAPIWLYKKSDGERVLYGSAPDYGAYEYDPGAAPQVTGSFGGNLR